MAKDDEKVTCPECGFPVGTKEDGTKVKAHKVAGERCDGSDQTVPSDDTDTDGIDKGQSYEPLDSAQDDNDETDKSTDPETPTEPETGTQGVATSAVAEFTHEVRVRKPAPHLDQADVAWHAANLKLVNMLAVQAGLVPTQEPRHVENLDAGTHVIVRYAVPVK